MKLVNLTINDFTSELASSSPAPGGGSAAAVSGSIASALISMVANLTIGGKKYEAYHESARTIEKEAEALRLRFLTIVDEDTASFNKVSDAFRLPKQTAEEKAARSAAIQSGLKLCTVTPFSMIEESLKGMKLIDRMLEGFNTSAASDLGVASLNFHSAAYGGWLNILINVSSIKDKDFVIEYQEQGKNLLKEIDALHNQILERVYSVV